MAPVIFCLILVERREAVMARSHLALAFVGWGGGGGWDGTQLTLRGA